MRSNPKPALMQTAMILVRRQGFSAFSYADLARAVGLRKATIHHHFPLKEDLGVAIVEAYSLNFMERLAVISERAADPFERLQAYAEIYRSGLKLGLGCLCGVLAAEIAVLPERVQDCIQHSFRLNLAWLRQTLSAAVDQNYFRADFNVSRAANLVLSTVQGASCLALSLGDEAAFEDAVAGLLAGLKSERILEGDDLIQECHMGL